MNFHLELRNSGIETAGEIFGFAYGRVSSESGTSTSGASRQEQSIEIQDRQFQDYIRSKDIPAEAFGDEFENFFLERHTGAFKFGDIRVRPEGARLWQALRQTREQHPHAPIHLIFSKVDRFSRGWLEGQIMLRDLRNMKVKLHILALGGDNFDCESDMGQKMVSDMLWFAEMEVKAIRLRIRENKNEWRGKGYHLGGLGGEPYGWTLEDTGLISGRGKKMYRLIDHPEEQQWILRMAQLREAGWSYHAIANELNRLQVPTKRGAGAVIKYNGEARFSSGRWQSGNVAKVLNNKTVCAWLVSHHAAAA